MIVSWNEFEYNKFVEAIVQNDLIVVSDLISINGKLDSFNNSSKYTSPLLVALDWREPDYMLPLENVELVQRLIHAGTDINARNATCDTPLIIAAWTKKLHTVVLLCEAGADVNASNEDGYTSLIAAAQYGYSEIVARLLSQGANVNTQTQQGLTALIMAAVNGHTKTVRILLEHDADINVVTNLGDTALSLAREARHYTIGRLLLPPATRL